MTTDAISSSSLAGLTGAPTPSSSTTAASRTRDQFLKLFVAQLEHQSPLDPQSGADMVAQLAQFSSVEQQVEMNTKLSDLTSAQDAAGSAALAGLVGHDATVSASTLTLDGPPPPLQIKLDGAITGGAVAIKDANGHTVRTITLGAGRGTFPLAWDGNDDRGVAVPPGTYTLEVTATGAGGTSVNGSPELEGRIDGLELGANGNHLRIGHALVTPADVLTIGAPGGIQ